MKRQRKLIAITQRVDREKNHDETRDGLDQRWSGFLYEAGFLPLILPNNLKAAMGLVKNFDIAGLILSGGNDLVRYQGDAPERDQLEADLIDYSSVNTLPLLGVCRGMQCLQTHFGALLQQVEGHVTRNLEITRFGKQVIVNSYHRWGVTENYGPFDVWAMSGDGVAKAISHQTYPFHGIMWHPEREERFDKFDLDLVQNIFGGVC